MHRLLIASVLLSLGLCACDSRRDFAGSYDVSGTLETTVGSRRQTSRVDEMPLVLVADALDSDALYLDFDCGLTGRMEEADSFKLDARKCPSYATDDGCTFTWTYRNGTGHVEAKDESMLKLAFSGTIDGRCDDGSSGQLSFTFTLTATRNSASSSGSTLALEHTRDDVSPQMSALRSELERAMRMQMWR